MVSIGYLGQARTLDCSKIKQLQTAIILIGHAQLSLVSVLLFNFSGKASRNSPSWQLNVLPNKPLLKQK